MNDDLLTPSLGSNDRADAYDRPWNPWHLVFVAFLGGIAAAAILQTINWRKLNAPERVLPTAIALGFFVLFIGLGSGYVANHWTSDGTMDGRTVRLTQRVVSVAIAVAVAAMQNRSFTLAERMDVEIGRLLWKPAILAILAGGVIQFLLGMLGTIL
ncbi:MAG: hypothetical protein KDA27_26680 [Candidatus Eisenbacteria bacterium]|uniref:Uncharacterized protein n=1 Tax=Eiseniibacteriota bacterium TaxID=2212470 RepID=A0A956NKE1_UNCEI|nr:hypothetical protein [Candidatus Eisenbacteria bacterium]